MPRRASLATVVFLGCLFSVNAELPFDGPFFHHVLMGSLVDLPCYVSESLKRHVLSAFTSRGASHYSLWWIHRSWDRVLDPWGGDGRRSYFEMSLSQNSDGIAESMGIFKVPWVSGMGLRVLSINPSDAGQYACLLSKRSVDQGFAVDMENLTLLSIHSVRVREASDPDIHDISLSETGQKNEGEALAGDARKKGVNSGDRKVTFFDAWTWHINKATSTDSEMTLFTIDCYADILLVGLALSGIDVNQVRVSWKFIDRSGFLISKAEPTERGCDSLQSDPLRQFRKAQGCEDDGDDKRSEKLAEMETAEGAWNLRLAKQVADQKLKARWLRVTPQVAFGSGTWQCWLEVPNLFTNKSTGGHGSKRNQVLVSEVRVFETPNAQIWWYNSVEVWRVMASLSAPACYFFFYLLVAISWAATMHWRHLLYHRPTRPKKINKTKKSKEEWIVHAEPQKSPSMGPTPYEFEELAYTKKVLTKHGIEAR